MASKGSVLCSMYSSVAPNPAKVPKIVAELKCSEIRWFCREDEESTWIPLRGYDSAVLEFAYRKKNSLALDDDMINYSENVPEVESKVVLDGLYKIDDTMETISPIYWPDDPFPIKRGIWFYSDTMEPLGIEMSGEVEKNHMDKFKGQRVNQPANIMGNKRVASLKWRHNKTVVWKSPAMVKVHINSERRCGRLLNFLSCKKSGRELRRGYNEETTFEEGRPDFSDVIFVVHGIGQMQFSNQIAINSSMIRYEITRLMDKHYRHKTQKPCIIPIEWRSTLRLDEGLTKVVTLPKISDVRNVLNSTALDIIYYQSPLYRPEIINGVIKCLNVSYALFKKLNPKFNGPISLIAHSLGSVILYDILLKWGPTPNQELQFKVQNLFCVGSPLSVFIIMRGCDPKTVIPDKQRVERMFNIFHPSDPIAYRLEPLIHRNYRHVPPVKLFSHRDAKNSYHTQIKNSRGMDKVPLDKRLEDRLDFEVVPATTDRGYLSAFTSHSSYWENQDVAAFVLNVIYQQVSS